MSSAKQANWNLGCSLLLTVVLVGGVLFYFRVKKYLQLHSATWAKC